MNTTRIAIVLATLVVAAGPVAGQAAQERISSALERARLAGLPVELLESKVAEGRAKNIPLDRIAIVVEQRGEALTRAARVLGGALPDATVPAADIAVGADALQAGVDETVLARVAGTAGHERRTVAIAALTQLVAGGVVPEEALERVQAAMRRGDHALMNLPGMAGQAGVGHGPPAGIPPAGRPAGTGRPPGAGPPGGNPPDGGGPPVG